MECYRYESALELFLPLLICVIGNSRAVALKEGVSDPDHVFLEANTCFHKASCIPTRRILQTIQGLLYNLEKRTKDDETTYPNIAVAFLCMLIRVRMR
jgi:hypothetical protein